MSPSSFVVVRITSPVAFSFLIVKLLESSPKFVPIKDISVSGSLNIGTSICVVFSSIVTNLAFDSVTFGIDNSIVESLF